jgi:hypothetical protein
MLHLAVFYEPIDLWLAFSITMDYVTVRPFIRADFVRVWKIMAHVTVTARHWGNLLNQSYSARALLIQSEC